MTFEWVMQVRPCLCSVCVLARGNSLLQGRPGNRNPAIDLDLPDLPRISDNICRSLLQGKPADMEDVKT